jgi:hypothetical protein
VLGLAEVGQDFGEGVQIAEFAYDAQCPLSPGSGLGVMA